MALLMPSATVLAMATPWLQRFWAWRPRTLSARLARVGVWVLLFYVLIALLSPLLFHSAHLSNGGMTRGTFFTSLSMMTG